MDSFRIVMVCLAALLFGMTVYNKSRQGVVTDTPAALAVSARQIQVMVGGDVRHPGVYQVAVNDVTDGVIKMAEPSRPIYRFSPVGADDAGLRNGECLRLAINKNGTATIHHEDMSVAQRMTMGIALEIDRMDVSDFDKLPGIGPAMAKRIVMFRQNNGGKMAPEDLQFVEGIGLKRSKQLMRYFQQADIVDKNK